MLLREVVFDSEHRAELIEPAGHGLKPEWNETVRNLPALNV